MINVAFCIDDNFAPYLAVSLASLIKNTDSCVSLNVVGNLSSEVKLCLRMLESEKVTINFIAYKANITEGKLSERYQGRLNGITFIRYALAEILPQLDRVVYLDADILVTGDIKTLWDESLDGKTVGVVEDHSLMSQNRPEKIALSSKSYFNAGVMLIDLAKWRENDTFQHLTSVHSSREQWEYNDQDVLNKVLDEQAHYLDAKFNAQTYTIMHSDVTSPVVVHFTGQEKPWHLSSAHPYTEQYRRFFENIPFENNTLSLFLDSEDHAILEKLKETFTTSGQIAIWGAGARGRRIIKALEQKLPHIVIKQVVDTNLTGKCFSFSIVSPENLMTEQVEAVVVATLPHKQDITNSLRHKALTVI